MYILKNLKCWFGLVMSSVDEVVKPFVGLFTRFPYLFSHCSPNTYLKQHANWHFYQCHTDDKYNIIISVVLVVVSVVKWYKSRSNSIFFDNNNCLNTMLLTNYSLNGYGLFFLLNTSMFHLCWKYRWCLH